MSGDQTLPVTPKKQPNRADPHTHRPVWMTAVCDQAELAELALSAYLSLGDFERAGAQAHRSLTLLRPSMQRDRALVTARTRR
nr:hypothetical protein [Streptomyces hygroscopicus]